MCVRAFIFHMSIRCDNTFPWFHYFIINVRAFILHMSISCDKIFLLVSKYLSLWPWPSLELAIIGDICISQTFYLNVNQVWWVHNIPDNLDQTIFNHTWTFLCFVVYWFKLFSNNNFYYLKMKKLLLEWPWSDVIFYIIKRNITQNL